MTKPTRADCIRQAAPHLAALALEAKGDPKSPAQSIDDDRAPLSPPSSRVGDAA